MADYNDKVVNAELILPEGDGGNIVGDDGQFHTEDTTTVSLLGNGTSTTPLKATVIVDPASGNAIVAGVDGLSVGVSPLSDNLLVLAGGKLYVAPPQIVIPISSKSGNTLVEVTDPGEEGLFVPPGEKGDKGDKGDQGDPGVGIYIQGVLSDPSQLPPASSLQEGDTYVIGTHYWTVTGGQWVDLGDFAGPQGQDGIGLVIKGAFADTSLLPQEGNTEGDTYIIQEQMWVWTGEDGWQPVGQVGPTGPAGPTGPQGPQGVPGQKGDKGDNATVVNNKGTLASEDDLPDTGNTVGDAYLISNDVWMWDNTNQWTNLGPIQGAQGPTGPTGPQGVPGPQGPKGDTGQTGLTGPVGPSGPAGPKGDRGETGYSARILGTKGSTTDLPATGEPGDAWIIVPNLYVWSEDDAQWTNVGPYVGPQGEKGDTGDTGPAGPKGDQGSDGPQGPKGDQGDQGPAGDQGPEGPMGVPLVPKGTVANEAALPTGASHGDYYTTNDTGEGFAFDGTTWVNLGVMRGPQGDQGPQGLQGDDGPEGPQGEVGPAGPTGPQGPKGDQGAGIKPLGTKASEADLPATGTEGDGWIIGTDLWVWSVTDNDWINVGGFVGPTGPQGPEGPQGPTGSQGIQGNKGDQGTLWLNFARNPGPADGRVGDYFINKSTLEYFQKTSATSWASLGYMGGGNVYDTSSTTPQARTSSGWVDVPVLEAPTDNKTYVRMDGDWAELDMGPTTEGYYVRSGGTWKKLDRYDLLVTSTTGAMDVNVSQVFKIDGTANKTMSFANLPSNRAMTIVIVFAGSGASLTWPGSLAWSNGTPVTLGTTRTVVTILWDGTNLTGTTSLTVN